jgi:hypothetical protein
VCCSSTATRFPSPELQLHLHSRFSSFCGRLVGSGGAAFLPSAQVDHQRTAPDGHGLRGAPYSSCSTIPIHLSYSHSILRPITISSFSRIQPPLEELNLCECKSLSSETLELISKSFPRMRKLLLGRCGRLAGSARSTRNTRTISARCLLHSTHSDSNCVPSNLIE